MEQPNYYSIIPASVRYDKRLKANEKLLYGEITSLANAKGYCYASNTYFSELYGTSERSIQLWICNLKNCGYLRVDISDNNTKRKIYITDIGVKKSSPPHEENFTPTPEENFTHNNTSINNKLNNTCSEEIPPNSKTVISLILNDKTLHPVTEYQVKEWSELYPAVDVMQELRNIKGWLDNNPRKRKTKRGINKFINAWLSRKQDRGIYSPPNTGQQTSKTFVPDAESTDGYLEKIRRMRGGSNE